MAFVGYTKYWLAETMEKWREDSTVEDKLSDPASVLVVLMYATGKRQMVVEREHNILSLQEALENEDECAESRYQELKKWHGFGTFRRK